MAIVGFKITDAGPLSDFQKQQAVNYISSVIFVPDPIGVATNIVANYATTNIFSKKVTQADLDALPFDTEVIDITANIFCWSIVDFVVEMYYRDYDGVTQTIRLLPTGWVNIVYSIAKQLTWWKDNNYIDFSPPVSQFADWSDEDFQPADWLTPFGL